MKSQVATVLGIAAIFMWMTTFAFSRSLAEQLGPLTASAVIYLFGGGLGCIYMFTQYGGFSILKGFSIRYLCICGGLFILYLLTLNLAIGWATNRQQAVDVVMINYLWPVLTMTFFVPILKYRAGIWLIPGIVLAIIGVCLAVTGETPFSFWALLQNIQTNRLPYNLGVIAAIVWALYSNFNRRFAAETPRSAIPIFILCCGVLCLGLSIMLDEYNAIKITTTFELLYAAIFPGLLAFLFWDVAMRKGNVVLLTSISYLLPLCSMVVTALYLHVPFGIRFWLASAMIIAGAVICKMSVILRQQLPLIKRYQKFSLHDSSAQIPLKDSQ